MEKRGLEHTDSYANFNFCKLKANLLDSASRGPCTIMSATNKHKVGSLLELVSDQE